MDAVRTFSGKDTSNGLEQFIDATSIQWVAVEEHGLLVVAALALGEQQRFLEPRKRALPMNETERKVNHNGA
jgi:hypothetical protein